MCLRRASPKIGPMRVIAIVTAAALMGCGEDPASGTDGGVDAPPDGPPGPCWPELTRTPQGSVTLGTGRDGFETMPDTLPLEYGAQDGFMLVANARMTGFAPGNPQDILDPGNPRTRVRAFFDETNVPLNYYAVCPFRSAYVASGSDYQLLEAAPIIFETCWRSEHLFGKKIRVELELMDANGGYATDVKVVTAAPPMGPHPIDQGSPGCIH